VWLDPDRQLARTSERGDAPEAVGGDGRQHASVHPDAEVLRRAGERLVGLRGVDVAGTRWHTTTWQERPDSVVFRLELQPRVGAPIVAYYKSETPNVPGRRFNPFGVSRASVERSPILMERLQASTPPGYQLVLPTILAVDPDTLTSVVLEVPGTPLARGMLVPRLPVGARLMTQFAVVGRGARLTESCTRPGEALISESGDAVEKLVDAGLDALASRISERRIRVLRTHANRLMRDADAADDPVYAHCDLNFSNVFVSRDGVGIIDFGWEPRPRGWDVGMFIASLRTASVRLGWGRGRLEAAALRGYGVADAAALSGFQLGYLVQLVLRAIRPGSDRAGTSVARALGRLDREYSESRA
jgi:Phosphotransferase enzyme family